MPAARYWRAIGLQPYSGTALELSALHLYLSGARVDATATLTSTIAPTAGTLANLQDDDTATVCRWLNVSAPGFALVWDFGVGNAQDVGAARFGSGALKAEFLEGVTLQYSSDAINWLAAGLVSGLAWPGANAMQAMPLDVNLSYTNTSLLLHFEGENDSATIVDSGATKRVPTDVGSGVKLKTAIRKIGSASCYFPGAGYQRIAYPASDAFVFGAGDFTIRGWCYITGGQSYARMVHFGPFWQSNNAFGINAKDADYPGKLTFASYKLGQRVLVSTTTIASNTWYHVEVIRAAGVFLLFINGILEATNSSFVGASIDASATNTVAIGGATTESGGESFGGYIDELQIIKGVALHTSSFTPPLEQSPDSSIGFATQASQIYSRPTPLALLLSGGPSAPAGPVLSPTAVQIDLQDGGLYRIVGDTKKRNSLAPLRRRVQLYNQRDSRLIRETWSDAATGDYAFNNVRGGDGTTYFVAGFDHTNTDKAVIADQLVPEPMP